MSNVKISDLPEVASPAATDIIPIVQGGVTYQSTIQDEVDACTVNRSQVQMATSKLLGRTTAGTGGAEAISVGAGLTLSGGTLTGDAVLLTSLVASNSASLSDTTHLTSTYKTYIFRLIDIRAAVDDDLMSFVVSLDSGASWKTDANYWNGEIGINASTSTLSDYQSLIDPKATFGDTTSSANYGMDGTIVLGNPSATGYKLFQLDTTIGLVGNMVRWIGAVSYHGATGAINGIKFQMDSGNIASGTIEIWGIK